ncbi:beta-lactamase hydrolase domain-containing protein [Thiohalorhabdus methylotrophus]|uniref:Beta-lactamase hydrolase domain-containing protein n=1 Tax=Thiohalorhabdus methylotrophus TaxID=3242694 RepID=A0ABV4TRV4_9GAMM
MMQTIKMDENYFVGMSVPDASEIDELAEQGFGSVANLREEGEEKEYLSPEEEADRVLRDGMEYFHSPVSAEALNEEQVDEFREAVSGMPKPVLIHCKSGKRSGAFTLMHAASEQGQPGEEAVEQAESMGFECENAEMEAFVKDYINRHNG